MKEAMNAQINSVLWAFGARARSRSLGRPWKPESKFVSSASGSYFISAFTMAAYYKKRGGLPGSMNNPVSAAAGNSYYKPLRELP